MNIDLRQPILVLAGHWNPHIFSLDWMAVNLFQIEAGDTVEVGQAMSAERAFPITYLNDVGLSCTFERLELFAVGVEAEDFQRVETVARKILELLSHTPVFGVGVNFRFFDHDVDAKFSDSLVTKEDLEAKYKIASTEVRSALQVGDGTTLNLVRALDQGGIAVAFNFHTVTTGTEIARALLNGHILEHHKTAVAFMNDFYDQSDFTVQRYGAIEGAKNDE